MDVVEEGETKLNKRPCMFSPQGMDAMIMSLDIRQRFLVANVTNTSELMAFVMSFM